MSLDRWRDHDHRSYGAAYRRRYVLSGPAGRSSQSSGQVSDTKVRSSPVSGS
jgi:hypothetical protein